MQIDVLSGNTLKLTLNEIDMSDMGIRYECLSEKNEQTKRLLSKVLNTVKLNASVDKNICFDFSGERLFVEAFPRPDGGCMLYISCLKENSSEELSVFRFPTETLPCSAQSKKRARVRPVEHDIVFSAQGFPALAAAVRALNEQPLLCGETSSLYAGEDGEYRLVFKTRFADELCFALSEYGDISRTPRETARTEEYFKNLCKGNAIKTLLPVVC